MQVCSGRPNHMPIVIVGMFSGQRSTLGNGLSGDPRCGKIAV